MFAIRKDGFKDHPVIQDGLDLVDEEDQFTHMLPLDDEYDPEDLLSESQQQGAALGLPKEERVSSESFFVCVRFSFNQTSSRWILTSWKMKRSTKPSKEVRMKWLASFCPDRLSPQSDQSSVDSWQISWMKAAVTPGRRQTAATATKTRRMRTRRKQKVRKKRRSREG